MSLMLNHIDYFVSQSRDNKTIQQLTLFLYSLDGQDDEFWRKFEQVIGNLQALEFLNFSNFHDDPEDDDDAYASLMMSMMMIMMMILMMSIVLVI